MNLKKQFLVIFSLSLVVLFIYMFKWSSVESILTPTSKTINHTSNSGEESLILIKDEINSGDSISHNAETTMLKGFRDYCLEQFPEYEDFPNETQLLSALENPDLKKVWTNTHLQLPDGDVLRVRVFIDDGPNGEIQRLAVYKEDEVGFPVLIELSDEEKTNPSPEVLQKYLSMGETIHLEEALSVEQNNEEYFFERINGEIVRIDITSDRGLINCQSLDTP